MGWFIQSKQSQKGEAGQDTCLAALTPKKEKEGTSSAGRAEEQALWNLRKG